MIIGSRWSYVGTSHSFLRNEKVQIVAIHRGTDCDEVEILDSDEEIGELHQDDVIEIAPIILENGKERLSFATSDARLQDLNPS